MQIDTEFDLLAKIINSLDAIPQELSVQIEQSDDPDSMSLFDEYESVVGLGLIASHNYLTGRI